MGITHLEYIDFAGRLSLIKLKDNVFVCLQTYSDRERCLLQAQLSVYINFVIAMFFSLNIPASEVLILICLPPMTFLAYRQRRSLCLCKLNNTANSLWLQTHRNSDDLVITNSPEEWNLSRHKFKVIEDMRSLSLQNVQHSEVFTLTYSSTAKSLSLQTHILTESDVLMLTHLPTVKSLSLYTYRQRCPYPDALTGSEVFILIYLPTAMSFSWHTYRQWNLYPYILTDNDVLILTHLPTVKSLSL